MSACLVCNTFVKDWLFLISLEAVLALRERAALKSHSCHLQNNAFQPFLAQTKSYATISIIHAGSKQEDLLCSW